MNESYINYLEVLVLSLMAERNSDADIVSAEKADPSFTGVTFSPFNIKPMIREKQHIGLRRTRQIIWGYIHTMDVSTESGWNVVASLHEIVRGKKIQKAPKHVREHLKGCLIQFLKLESQFRQPVVFEQGNMNAAIDFIRANDEDFLEKALKSWR
jgi:hypothetical protein